MFEEAIRVGQWEEAADLYHGDFLAGFHISDAPEFEHWMETTRAHLRDCATRAAWTLAERDGADAHPAKAVRWAQWAARSFAL